MDALWQHRCPFVHDPGSGAATLNAVNHSGFWFFFFFPSNIPKRGNKSCLFVLGLYNIWLRRDLLCR